jgi:1,2-diacylglycerol 3-beta-galactosyltransferase
MQRAMSLLHRPAVRLLERYFRAARPDMVVSLVPNVNRALFEALRASSSRAPLVTILTDLADCPPHFWIERQPQFFICGSDQAVEQATEIATCRCTCA